MGVNLPFQHCLCPLSSQRGACVCLRICHPRRLRVLPGRGWVPSDICFWDLDPTWGHLFHRYLNLCCESHVTCRGSQLGSTSPKVRVFLVVGCYTRKNCPLPGARVPPSEPQRPHSHSGCGQGADCHPPPCIEPVRGRVRDQSLPWGFLNIVPQPMWDLPTPICTTFLSICSYGLKYNPRREVTQVLHSYSHVSG